MNTLVIVLIAAVVLVCAYAGYGRWLAKTWGVDPNAKTPAVRLEDGKDYVPTNGWTVFAHQFSSIAGAGPVTGAIQAAAFGWLPVLLWVLLTRQCNINTTACPEPKFMDLRCRLCWQQSQWPGQP